MSVAQSLLTAVGGKKFGTILADPPWQFQNKTGKVAPEHRRLSRYDTMTLEEIKALPIREVAATPAHLYLWVPNALLPEGLAVLARGPDADLAAATTSNSALGRSSTTTASTFTAGSKPTAHSRSPQCSARNGRYRNRPW